MDRPVLFGSLGHAAVIAAAFGICLVAQVPLAYASAFALGLAAAMLDVFGHTHPVTPIKLFGFEELRSRVASGAVAVAGLCLIVSTQPVAASDGLGNTAGSVVASVAGALLLMRLPRFWASPPQGSCASIDGGSACTAGER